VLGGTKVIAELLVTAGMFDRADDGYLIHDFLVFNDSAVTVQARRDEAAERQRRHRSVTRDVTRESQRESQRDTGVSHSTHARASALASRPVPSSPDLGTPISPPSGDSGNPRANGTNPRAQGTSPRQVAGRDAEGKRHRRNQRALAYARGAISEDQQADMDRRDAPLSEIPDRLEHQKSLAGEDWLGVKT
jgi:hypothetical protein